MKELLVRWIQQQVEEKMAANIAEIEKAKAEAVRIRAEAGEEVAERIARNLLADGVSFRETAKLTGLYISVVVRLRDTMRAES